MDPPWGSIIYAIGVLESRIGGYVFFFPGCGINMVETPMPPHSGFLCFASGDLGTRDKANLGSVELWFYGDRPRGSTAAAHISHTPRRGE